MSIFGGRDAPEVRAHTRRVVVKFVPALQLPHSEAAEIEHASAHPHAWEALRSKFPGVTLRPLFTTLDVATLERLEQRAVAAGTSPRLTSYFAIVVPEHADSAEIVQAVAAWPHVELAYVEGGPVPPPVNSADDTLSGNQKYLSAAPVGIDAHFAWTQTDGSGIGLVNLEQGWTLDHEDLPAPITAIGSIQQIPEWAGHGTAVLGIVAAVDNNKGVVGIAPQATVRVVSQWFGTHFNTAEAIAAAIVQMQAGDVLLLETTVTTPDPTFGLVPVEVQPLVFDLIKMATSIGIMVLEPAGHKIVSQEDGTFRLIGSNLDAFRDNNGKFLLNRATPDFKDSGAIIVGAASSLVPHERLSFSNFGSRVDCHAWGEHIATCGGYDPFDKSEASPQKTYTLNFGGTSGATAIVAGAAVLIQSWAVKHLGSPLSTSRLRALLSDVNLNTHSKTPSADKIGVMPDLKRILLNLTETISNRWDVVFSILIGGVIYGGGGWRWTPAGGLQPIPPREDRVSLTGLSLDKRDVLIGLAMLELAGLISDPASRKAMERSSATLMRSASEKVAEEIEQR